MINLIGGEHALAACFKSCHDRGEFKMFFSDVMGMVLIR